MKLLTVNMYAKAGNLSERLEALGKMVQTKRPEFLVLQGVSNDLVKNILSTTWGSRYNASQPPTRFETRGKPTVAILSTYPAQDVKTVYFRRTQNNCLLLAAFYVMYDKQKSPHAISVCATSLEVGRDHSDLREVQLNEALMSRSEDQDCFIMAAAGLNDIDGDIHLNSPWKDAWLSVDGHTANNGDTYVPSSNPLIQDKTKLFSGRPDRFFYKTRRYRLDSMQVMGPDAGGCKVSPHFGLLTMFSPLEEVAPPHDEEAEVACFFERPQWGLTFEQNKK